MSPGWWILISCFCTWIKWILYCSGHDQPSFTIIARPSLIVNYLSTSHQVAIINHHWQLTIHQSSPINRKKKLTAQCYAKHQNHEPNKIHHWIYGSSYPGSQPSLTSQFSSCCWWTYPYLKCLVNCLPQQWNGGRAVPVSHSLAAFPGVSEAGPFYQNIFSRLTPPNDNKKQQSRPRLLDRGYNPL